ncbi:potassium-transporting ATPase subunit KdpA [Pseudotabrizicola formosa]|uniref:potassium-transporting ATPase subunit KdpA n=1 Tax=Pseudotabrizicola formosa TaxID=2030009 RepID=UPI00338F53DE
MPARRGPQNARRSARNTPSIARSSPPLRAPDLAFHTAVSFVTKTNWQAYSGETHPRQSRCTAS